MRQADLEEALHEWACQVFKGLGNEVEHQQVNLVFQEPSFGLGLASNTCTSVRVVFDSM